MDRKQTYLVMAMLAFFAVTLLGAYWYSGLEQKASASGASSTPVKKFRAKPGTERENAMALLSSAPEQAETTTDKPVEIWGSLGSDDEVLSRSVIVALNAAQNPNVDQGIEGVLDEIRRLEGSGETEDLAVLHATLGHLYVGKGQGFGISVETAFNEALRLAGDGPARVPVLRLYAKSLLEVGLYERAVALADREKVAGLPPSRESTEILVIQGVAYEQLGRDEDAIAIYENTLTNLRHARVTADAGLGDIVRQAGLRLSKLYREAGQSAESKAVMRTVRELVPE